MVRVTEERIRRFEGNDKEQVWNESQAFISSLSYGQFLETSAIMCEDIRGEPMKYIRRTTYRVSGLTLSLEESRD